MNPVPRRAFIRRSAPIALIVFLGSYALMLGLSLAWAHDAAAARVIVLGSGTQLSVLVTAGPSRLLIATGDDSTSFGNALTSALPPTARRIDIVLLAGTGPDATVPAYLLMTTKGRYHAILGAAPSPRDLDAPGGARIDRLTEPRRFDLARGVTVTIEVEDQPSADATAWRAIIQRDQTRVVVLSDGEHASLFNAPGPVSSLVLVRGLTPDAIVDSAARSIVINPGAASRETVRDLLESRDDELVVVRVFPGESQELEFVNGGLKMPTNATIASGRRSSGAIGNKVRTVSDQ